MMLYFLHKKFYSRLSRSVYILLGLCVIPIGLSLCLEGGVWTWDYLWELALCNPVPIPTQREGLVAFSRLFGLHYKHNYRQWWLQSCQVTRAGDTCGVHVSLWVEKNPVPPPNRWALDWSVVLTVGRLCPIVLQDNILVRKKRNWPQFYLGNAQVWIRLWLQDTYKLYA